MRWLVLDPMNGRLNGRVFEVSATGALGRQIDVGYCAEVRFHAHTNELVILESVARLGSSMEYYVRVLDAGTFNEVARRKIPVRPMYAGFPGRSVGASVSSTGRYIYFLRTGPVIEFDEDLVFRLTPVRWDRTLDRIETGSFHIDSCHIDYGLTGTAEDDLFLHLSCECPSTVAFGRFDSPECHFLRLEDLARRQHDPLETTSSWHNLATSSLFCVNRLGTIYEVLLQERARRVLTSLPLSDSRGVPLHQICGTSDAVYVGVAMDDGEMGLGMVAEIWTVALPSGDVRAVRTFSRPVMNFVVSSDGGQIAGVDPYTRTISCLDVASGDEIWSLPNIGATPAELIAIT